MKEQKRLSSSQSETSTSRLSPASSFRKSRRKNESDFYRGSTSSIASTISSYSGTLRESSSESLSNETPNLLTRFLEGYKRRVLITLIIPGILVGIVYFYSISHHFHSITNFSSLTSVEKELSLPPQSSVRYSTFKKIALENNLIEGIRKVVSKNEKTQAVPRDGISCEIVLGSAFHLLQKLFQDFTSINSSQECRTWRQVDEKLPKDGTVKDDWRCLADPLTFYIMAYWVIEAIFVGFLYINSSILSGSCLGGFLSVLTFTLHHPQLNDLDRMFPDTDKLGSYLAAVQLSLVPHFLLTRSHPSWTNAAKMAMCVALMIFAWEKEAQWILCTQLLVTLLIHFVNGLSPYRTSIVLAAHIVGWEYATFARLDMTFAHWSFYGYLLLASLLCMFIMEPIVDKCFGDKIDKWMFLRAIILTLAFHICSSHIRLSIGPVLHEDSRMTLLMGGFKGQHPNETWTTQSSSGGVIAQERDFGSTAPWLKAIEEQRRFKGNDLWTRRTSYDYWHKSSPSLASEGGRQRRFTTTGRTGNVNLESIGSLVQEKKISEFQEQISSEESEHLISTRQLNDVLHRLKLCNQSKSIIPVSQLLRENVCIFCLTFFTVISSVLLWYRKSRFLEETADDEYESHLKRTTKAYLLLSILFLTFLATSIHHKFYFLLLIQMSILIADIPNHTNYSWITSKILPGKEKLCGFLLYTSLVSVMLGMGKLRVDEAQFHPHQSDPGLGESLELVSWWNENSASFTKPVIFGSRDSVSKIEASANASFLWNGPVYDLSILRKWNSEKEIFTILSQLLCKKETSTPETLHESLSNLNITHLFLTPETCSDSSLMFIMPRRDSFYKTRRIESSLPDDDETIRFHRDNKPSFGNKRGIRSSRSVLVNPDGGFRAGDDETIIPTINTADSICDVKNRLCEELDIQKGDSLCSKMLAHRDRKYEDSIKPFHRLFYNRLYTILEL